MVHELVSFAVKHNIKPTVLIPDEYNKEYYDEIFAKMNVPVVRTSLTKIHRLRNPVNLIKAIFWRIKLKYFINREFDSVQFINLIMMENVGKYTRHSNRFVWHITNSAQYPGGKYIYPKSILANPNDSIVYINNYQEEEINKDYADVKVRQISFKLFLNKQS